MDKCLLFVENNEESLCLNCMKTITVAKGNNIKRHFNSKHALKFKALQDLKKCKKASKVKKKHSLQQSVAYL